MKIAFFDLAGWEIPIIEQQCQKLGLDLIKASTAQLDTASTSSIKDVEILSVFLSKVDQSMMQQLPHLKLISIRATGTDKVDIAFAKNSGVVVTNLPSYAEETVAEYAMALILMLSRRLGITLEQSLHGTFDQKTTRGHDLAGKTIGIIGTGKIGRRLIKIASGFDMNIICYDKFPKPEKITPYKSEYVELDKLFKQSDIISIHLPYTKDTHHLINCDVIKLLKSGVLFVNVSRGPIVDLSALRQGLKDNILGGVALDTFEGETIWINEQQILEGIELPAAITFKQAVEAFSLQSFENVILTPHNAYNSYEAIQRMINTTLSDIADFCRTGNCENRIV